MANDEVKNHEWPRDQAAHVYGPWRQYSLGKVYRQCVHTDCGAHEIQDTPKG